MNWWYLVSSQILLAQANVPYRGPVNHACVNALGHHWFRYWLDSRLASSHYLNKRWFVAMKFESKYRFRTNKPFWTHRLWKGGFIMIQFIPRNMHTVFALLCFVVVIHWLIFPYPSGLLHWHCGNLTIAPVPAKQPWWIWINTSCEFIMNDCIATTKQSTTKPCAYFLGYTVNQHFR